jgi:hypothetical protein
MPEKSSTQQVPVKKNSVPVNLPITEAEHHGLKVVAAMNGWTIREQVAQWIKEGLARDFPGGA